jgi:DNA-directed RNA polymerase delta subunit
MKKSMIEVAYEIVSASETPLSFQNLWKQVVMITFQNLFILLWIL